MASPQFVRTVASLTYKGQPYVLGQVRYDYFNWGNRTVIFDGTAVPAIGAEVAMEGKDESGGANAAGWAAQFRFICPAAGRPQHPLDLQLHVKSAGSHQIS